MCIPLDIADVYRQSFAHTVNVLRKESGTADPWSVDLRTVPMLRAKAFAGSLGKTDALLGQALHFAGRLRWLETSAVIRQKQAELVDLQHEARAARCRGEASLAADRIESLDVVVLDADWGKPGRAAKIVAWILATGADAAAIAERFQLAASTARKYRSIARRGLTRTLAA